MLKIQRTIPRKVGVAVSGGLDSMAVLHFLSRNHDVTAYHFNHDTDHGQRADEFVANYCFDHKINLQRGLLQKDKPKDKSMEEHWRHERYDWLHSFDETIVAAHHLDDCVETYVFKMLHGTEGIIPYNYFNVIRPFRLTARVELEKYASKHRVPYLKDPSNDNTMYIRNYIRHELMPKMLTVNPGLHKVVLKKVLQDG